MLLFICTYNICITIVLLLYYYEFYFVIIASLFLLLIDINHFRLPNTHIYQVNLEIKILKIDLVRL